MSVMEYTTTYEAEIRPPDARGRCLWFVIEKTVSRGGGYLKRRLVDSGYAPTQEHGEGAARDAIQRDREEQRRLERERARVESQSVRFTEPA